jgi:gas vesicle protein
MRLILASFNNVLGLNGCLSFVERKPLLIYGENIAGKSNIINMLRYCLIPKVREKKGYAEEKRLRKDEILLEKNTSGNVEIYFEQTSKFYKLSYSFSRKGKYVGQLQRIYETDVVELPLDDSERNEALKKLEWKDLGASSHKSLKEKLVEIGIYPEVLDILISASNVRNFSEAINGSVVKVPEMVAAKISNLHDNSGKYLDNLKKLYGVLVLEKEEFERRMKELRTEFENISKNLPEMKVNEIFIPGATARNLENIQSALSKDLETMPEKTSEMKETLALLSSEKYDLWTGALDKTVAILPKKEELKSLLEKESHFEKLQDTLNKWITVFEQLPPDSNPENVLTFTIPEYEKFDFSVFSSPDRMKSIFSLTKDAIERMQRVSEICEKYRVIPKVSQINDMIKSYDDLFRVLKNPSEPIGDPALISRRNEKTLVSIPLDVAVAKVDYLKGIEPTPLIHRPEKLNAVNFREEIARVQKEIGPSRAELRKAKSNLSEVKKLLKKVKQLRDNLNREIGNLKENRQKAKKSLEKLVEDWTNAYHHLCEVFKIGYEKLDLSCPDSIDSGAKIISEKYAKAQEIFELDLTQHLKDYPEIMEKYKGQKPMDIVKKVTKEFKERIDRMMERQKEYRKVNEWILANSNQIKALENRNKTRDIMTLGLVISLEILSRVHEKADIKRIVEELADRIEVNVKDVCEKIFPEDESFSFKHLKEGQFLSTINNEPITHPSGSQKVAISMGIMLSLGETFGLPILLDEAFDRIDVNRLRFFSEYITGIAGSPQTPQICLAGFTTFNIEKNPEVLHFANSWKIYLVKRAKVLEKNIQLLKELPSS